MMRTDEELGELAYTVYRDERHGKGLDGKKIPKWSKNENDGIKRAWVESAKAVKHAVLRDTDYDESPPPDDSDDDDGGLAPNPDAITATQIQTPMPDTRLDERDESSTG